MNKKIIFYRWLCGWANLIDGLIVILSLGFFDSGLSLYAEERYLYEVENNKAH